MQRLDPDKSIRQYCHVQNLLYPLMKKVKAGARERPELIYFHEMLSLLKSTAQGSHNYCCKSEGVVTFSIRSLVKESILFTEYFLESKLKVPLQSGIYIYFYVAATIYSGNIFMNAYTSTR